MADWDVSLVTDMLSLFNGKSQFNADISRWDVSCRHEHAEYVLWCQRVRRGHIAVGRQLGHEHEVHVL